MGVISPKCMKTILISANVINLILFNKAFKFSSSWIMYILLSIYVMCTQNIRQYISRYSIFHQFDAKFAAWFWKYQLTFALTFNFRICTRLLGKCIINYSLSWLLYVRLQYTTVPALQTRSRVHPSQLQLNFLFTRTLLYQTDYKW